MRGFLKKSSLLALALMALACSSKGPSGAGGGGNEAPKPKLTQVSAAELDADFDSIENSRQRLIDQGLSFHWYGLPTDLSDPNHYIRRVRYKFIDRSISVRSSVATKEENISALQQYIQAVDAVLSKYEPKLTITDDEDGSQWEGDFNYAMINWEYTKKLSEEALAKLIAGTESREDIIRNTFVIRETKEPRD
ncbi:MAG: hypothetical protein AB1540_02395 [Bdellovibrionota bacterium]